MTIDIKTLCYSILGNIILNDSLFDAAVDLGLEKNHFPEQDQIAAWESILTIKKSKMIIDIASLGSTDISNETLARCVSSASNEKSFETVVRQVIQGSVCKKASEQLIFAARQLIEQTDENSFTRNCAYAMEVVEGLKSMAIRSSKETRFQDSIIDSFCERYDQRVLDNKNNTPSGIKSGLTRLDDNITGFMPGRFYIIAARTSIGKTTFASHLALKCIIQNKKTVIFSNEMDAEDIYQKFVSSMARVNSRDLEMGTVSEEKIRQMHDVNNILASKKFGINEHFGWRLNDLERECYRLKKNDSLDIVFVDYTQQVGTEQGASKYEQVSAVSDRLKKLSRDLKIPVIGLAQINRESERGGKPTMPGLSQLKDSGSLEQDADVVMILHKENIADSMVYLNVAKNRHGRTGVVNLKHEIETNSYKEWI